MAEHFYGCTGGGGAVSSALRIGFVETETATADAALHGGEEFDGLFAEQSFAAVFTAVEPHLVEFGQVAGAGKEAGVAGDAAEQGGTLIVNVAADQLFAEKGVVLGRWYPVDGEGLQRKEGGGHGS